MEDKVKIGISACLLGEKVRFDGGHKLDRYLTGTLGFFVEWVPVCPEVECGLGIPREAMRLVGEIDEPRLMTIRSRKDYTDQMLSWARRRVQELEREDIVPAVSPTSCSRSMAPAQVDLFGPGCPHPVVAALEGLDVDGMTPRQALEKLYDLKSRL